MGSGISFQVDGFCELSPSPRSGSAPRMCRGWPRRTVYSTIPTLSQSCRSLGLRRRRAARGGRLRGRSAQPTGVDPSPTLHHRQGDTHSWLSFATDLQALVTSSNLNDCPRNLTAGLTTVRPPTCRKLCSWEPRDVKVLERHSVLWDPLTDGPGIRRKKEDEDLTTSRKESPSTDYLQIKEQDPYWPV